MPKPNPDLWRPCEGPPTWPFVVIALAEAVAMLAIYAPALF